MCLTWTRAEEALLGRGGRPDFPPSFTPAKRLTGFGLPGASAVETASIWPPSAGRSSAKSWLCTSWPLTQLQGGYQEAKESMACSSALPGGMLQQVLAVG